MTARPSLLATALVLGLSVGCTNNRPPSEVRPAESGGTPAPVIDATPNPGPAPTMNPSGEAPSGGTATDDPSKPTIYFIKDSGIRCIAPPCPVYIATRPDRPDEDGLKVTSLDLSSLGLSQEQKDGLFEASHHGAGVKLEATVKTVPKAGPGGAATILVVSRLIDSK